MNTRQNLPRSACLFMATLAMGLIAGFFYTYEVSVMRGFSRLADQEFITSMQSVNATVRNWGFAPSFFGAVVLAVVTAAWHLYERASLRGILILAAALLYGIGGFFLTLQVNVPMNEWLAAQGPAALIAAPGAVRAQYEADWVFWNLVRTINSGIAFAMMAGALWLDGRHHGQSVAVDAARPA